jgi:hypothetical protein
MNNNSTKIVTLIRSTTEIVGFLGQKNSIIGRSHECDYPLGLNHVAKEIFAEIIHPDLFNFNHKEVGWINFHD